MRYGFVIDQDRCIGCHACTVACKEEHQVPVGVFRTWVKYVEKGEYPHTSRHFGVLRCNHCDDSPCTEICPTKALFVRDNGIVDFDSQRCIGCKSCMQACPYDAIYIDPNTDTAAKCNFCAHRVEVSLEPACVIVCPTQAIIAGDMDNSASRVSRIVATQKVSVRKPQKGTQPKLFYVGIEGDLLQPTRLARQSSYHWADRRNGDELLATTVAGLDTAQTREVYDVPHPAPWGWKIGAYLWTKSIAAGVLMVAALLMSMYPDLETNLLGVVSPTIALIALAATLGLLVHDLKRPDRFYYLLTKPNFRSWLVIGAYILMAYGAAALAWLVCGLRGTPVPGSLAWVAAALGAASAGYSAFLFAQAKGRDLWQSPLFLWHLLVQAMVAGSAVLILAAAATGITLLVTPILLLLALFLNLGMVVGDVVLPHVSEDVKLAMRALTHGPLRARFWGTVAWGLIVPVLLSLMVWNGAAPVFAQVAAALALAGLWWFEALWVKAGQAVPLS